MNVGVAVGSSVGVAVEVLVAVIVGVAVGVWVAVAVGVDVGGTGVSVGGRGVSVGGSGLSTGWVAALDTHAAIVTNRNRNKLIFNVEVKFFNSQAPLIGLSNRKSEFIPDTQVARPGEETIALRFACEQGLCDVLTGSIVLLRQYSGPGLVLMVQPVK